MNRRGRLASARTWLPAFSGKNVLRGYCKHFAVDWRCAAIELKMLGVKIDPAYLAQRDKTEAEAMRQRQEKKQLEGAAITEHWHPYTDPMSAYLDGSYEALYDLELRQRDDPVPVPTETWTFADPGRKRCGSERVRMKPACWSNLTCGLVSEASWPSHCRYLGAGC